MTETPTRSTAELVMDVADDVRLLIRKEIELARIELMEGLRSTLVGSGVIALAVLGLLPALLFGLFALVFWLPFSEEVSYAIVAGGLLVFAVIGTLIGVAIIKRRRISLEKTTASIREDVKWAREQMTS